MGHYANKCPQKKQDQNKNNNNNSNNNTKYKNNNNSAGKIKIEDWQMVPPAEGASEVNTVNGVEYKYCKKCYNPVHKCPIWRTGDKRHTTSEHKTKS